MSRLNEILQIVTANSEEAVDDFLTLLSPEKSSKEEIQSTFEDVIGYDPTSYFDKETIGEKLDDIADDNVTPEETSSYIKENMEDVIREAYDAFEENKDEYLDIAIDTVLEEKTGWSGEDPDDDDEDYVDAEYFK